MDIYAYGTPGTRGDLLRTEEIIKEYAECGFNVTTLFGDNAYNGEGWENSNAKKSIDLYKKVGIERVILDDMRLIELVHKGDSLIGDGEEFCYKNTEELDAYVKECMREYAHEKAIYGIRICDEPDFPRLHSCGYVYRSVKRVGKELGMGNVYVHLNLLPLVGDHPFAYAKDGVERTVVEEYEYYLDSFLKETGADVISVDNYPFRPRATGGIFLLGYFTCFQILKKACDKYGAKMAFVLQSFEMIHRTIPTATAGFRKISTINEMMLQTNAALGFGAQELSFFIYATNLRVGSNYGSSEGSSFICSDGTKARIYEFGKTAIAHARKVNEFLSGYQFSGAKLFLDESCSPECKGLYLGGAEFTTMGGTSKGAEFDNTYQFSSVEKIENARDIMLVTEFNNASGSVIMIENVLDIVYKNDLAPMKVTVKLKDAGRIKVLRRGEIKIVNLVDGVYETELNIGEADFIEII